MTAPRDPVSVVVCAYTADRWDLLVEAITSVDDQLSRDDELILVIDHNPSLFELARSQLHASVGVVENREQKGLSGARNTGVALAGNAIIAFLDDDAAPAPNWLDELIAPLASTEVVGTGGRVEPRWLGDRPWWLPHEFFWVVGCSYAGLPERVTPIRNPIGCSMAFRTDAVRAAGGFPHNLGRVNKRPAGCEETALAISISAQGGGLILYCPDSVVNHAVPLDRCTIRYFVARCYMEGRSKATLAQRLGAADATSSERKYLLTLIRGVTAGLRSSERSIGTVAAQSAVMLLGLGATTSGFVEGQFRRRDE